MFYYEKSLIKNIKSTAFACLCLVLFQKVAYAQPANDNCSSAQLLCSNESLSGTTADATPGDSICFLSNATVWYTFTTNEKGGQVNVHVVRDSICGVSPTTGDGLQGVILRSTDSLINPCSDPSFFLDVSNCVSGEDSMDISSQQIEPYTQYWIQIDGLLNDQGAATQCGFDISISGAPVEISAGGPISILNGEADTLNGSGVDGTFSWSPSDSLIDANTLSPIASPGVTTTYTLTGNIGGCSDLISTVKVTVDEDPIKPVTAFTPNGDGFNDTWEIRDIVDFPNALIEVYNRWGQRVFVSIGYNAEWDGTRDGTPLPEGTYYWVIQANRSDISVPKAKTGFVAIIR